MVFDDGVAVTSRSRVIAAPLQAIWDVLADFGSLSSWVDRADHSCVLNHAPDGNVLGTTRRIQFGRLVAVETVTEFEAGAALAYDVAGLPPMVRTFANRWTLRPDGDGTEVTITTTAEARTRLLNPIVRRVASKQADELLACLARRMEKPHV